MSPNTEDDSMDRDERTAYLKWCKKEGREPGTNAAFRWAMKKWDEVPNPWLEWLRKSSDESSESR